MHFMFYNFRNFLDFCLIYILLLFLIFYTLIFRIDIELENVLLSNDKNPKPHDLINDGPITEDEMNMVNFNPIEGEGAMGTGVIIPPEEQIKMERLYKINSFNLLASDRIPLNRTLFDCRSKHCQLVNYPKNLPNTSIIIIFHNEAWSVLLRMIWSIVTRTPRHLLKEIILVDDASDREYLKDRLDQYIKKIPVSIKIIRMHKRVGIVPSRLAGANAARGDVLTFLDSHCECSPGWAEPLLQRIKQNRHIVVCPVIDVVFHDDFRYGKAIEFHYGAIDWKLIFNWYRLDEDDSRMKDRSYEYQPMKTPAMSGGLFSMDRNYFFEMGGYDPDMKSWGGENLEMSLRIWQCGGQIEIHPCSHVGHVFRKSTPYTFPGGLNKILGENIARAALVWTDEWSKFFFKYNTDITQYQNNINVNDRLDLRKRLNCKSFSWYLKNIWPLNFYPNYDRFFGKIVWLPEDSELTALYGKIKDKFQPSSEKWSQIFKTIWNYNVTLLNTLKITEDMCLTHIDRITIADCSSETLFQELFVITTQGYIMTNENKCLDYIDVGGELSPHNTNVRLIECADTSRQRWKYDMNTHQIIHKQSKLCLTLLEEVETEIYFFIAEDCSKSYNEIDYSRQWGFIPLQWQ